MRMRSNSARSPGTKTCIGSHSQSDFNVNETSGTETSRRNSLRKSTQPASLSKSPESPKRGKSSRYFGNEIDKLEVAPDENKTLMSEAKVVRNRKRISDEKRPTLSSSPQLKRTKSSTKRSPKNKDSLPGKEVIQSSSEKSGAISKKQHPSTQVHMKNTIQSPRPRGKEGKLLALRDEHIQLTTEVRSLKREVEIWKNRLKSGRRLAKFNREMKPLDDEAKKLEPLFKQLRTKVISDRKIIENNEKCMQRMLVDAKKVLAATKISNFESRLTNGKDAINFFKSLSSREKGAVREAVKHVDLSH